MLHHLQSSHNVPLGVCQSLALLQSDQLGYLPKVGLYQLLIPEHDLLPGHGARLAPRTEGRLGALYSLLHLSLSGLGHLSHHSVGGRVVDINPLVSPGLAPLTSDDVLSPGRDLPSSVAQAALGRVQPGQTSHCPTVSACQPRIRTISCRSESSNI